MGYSVVRACLDDTSEHAVPVGVAAWDTPNEWQMWRWLEEDERVRGIDRATRRLMWITRKQDSALGQHSSSGADTVVSVEVMESAGAIPANRFPPIGFRPESAACGGSGLPA